jgi:predicted HicB family RNase H-like nuclease
MTRAGTITLGKAKPAADDDGARKGALLQVRISDDLRDEAAREAEAMGVSLSDFVRMAVIQLLAKQKRDRES